MVELNPTIFQCSGYTGLHLITKVSMHKVESNFQENNVITIWYRPPTFSCKVDEIIKDDC